jgi:hypothetical protein
MDTIGYYRDGKEENKRWLYLRKVMECKRATTDGK